MLRRNNGGLLRPCARCVATNVSQARRATPIDVFMLSRSHTEKKIYNHFICLLSVVC